MEQATDEPKKPISKPEEAKEAKPMDKDPMDAFKASYDLDKAKMETALKEIEAKLKKLGENSNALSMRLSDLEAPKLVTPSKQESDSERAKRNYDLLNRF